MKRLSVIIVVLILLLGGVSCDENGVGPTPLSDTTQPPPSDTTSPLITNVSAQEISETTVTITWTTNELATSQVEYGKTTNYALTTTVNEEFVTTHIVSLTDLTPNTSYHYRVRSKDNSNNEAISGDHTFTTSSVTGQLLVHFIDVGQGDSILIDLGNTEILIDGGGRTSGVANYLSDFVDGNLEVIIATHPHADHIGGLIAVFQAFTVEQVWHSGDTSTSKTYGDFTSAIQAEGSQITVVDRGDVLTVGELTFEVLHPASLTGTTNNQSIVLSLTYRSIDFLFTGDAEQQAESSMLSAGLLSDINILKVGHHGSHSSSSIPFLNVIQPEVAIYMAGAGNSYGHPHDETIDALCNIGADIYGTDVHGTVIITVEDGGYTVQHENQVPPLDCSTVLPPPPSPSPPSTSANVQITDIFYDGIVPQVESDEYVEITNLGTEPVNLQGWRLIDIDEGYPEFIFPNYILNPGQSIRVYTNEIHPEYGGFSFHRGTAVWNNSDPDTAVLYNAQGQEVSRKSY